MRIWDIHPCKLCRSHLLGEHRELHAVWSILTQGKKGYSGHPETKRWEGKLKALSERHEKLVREMCKRGYEHKSCLDPSLAKGRGIQDKHIDAPEQQIRILKRKKCGCRV